MNQLRYPVAVTALVAACSGSTVGPDTPPNVGGAGQSNAGSHAGSPAMTAGQSPVAGGAGGAMTVIQAGEGGEPNAAGSGGAVAAECDATDVQDIPVYTATFWDPLGYPPYAVDACRLVYVAEDQSLHLRDLATSADAVLDAADAKPRRPSLAGDVIAWEVDDGGVSKVRVNYQGNVTTLLGDFDHLAEPRATPDAVVLTAFLGKATTDDSDVYLYTPATDKLTPVATGPSQQRFADVSLTHVAFTDFTEDPRGYFDDMSSLADVVIFDRKTGKVTRRAADGKQAFPLLGSDGTLAYLEWGAVHPEPKFSQFWLKTGTLTQALPLDVKVTDEEIQTNPAYVRPSLRGRHLDFVDTRNNVVGLYRVDVGGTDTPLAAIMPGNAQLFGPVAHDALTLVSRRVDGKLSLSAVER